MNSQRRAYTPAAYPAIANRFSTYRHAPVDVAVRFRGFRSHLGRPVTSCALVRLRVFRGQAGGRNGNFVLTELHLDTTLVPEPAAHVLMFCGIALRIAMARRHRAALARRNECELSLSSRRGSSLVTSSIPRLQLRLKRKGRSTPATRASAIRKFS